MSAAGTDEQFSLNIGFSLSTWIELSLPDGAPLLNARKDTEASRTISSRARCIDSALRQGRIGSILTAGISIIRTRHSVFGQRILQSISQAAGFLSSKVHSKVQLFQKPSLAPPSASIAVPKNLKPGITVENCAAGVKPPCRRVDRLARRRRPKGKKVTCLAQLFPSGDNPTRAGEVAGRRLYILDAECGWAPCPQKPLHYRKLSRRPLITRLTGFRRGGRVASLIERGQRRGAGVLPLDILFDGAQGMIPHHVVHESRKQHPGNSPQNPTRKAVAFFVVECRVNGQPAVSVLGRCDIEDELAVVRKPPVELVLQGLQADSLGQAQLCAESGERHPVSNDRSDLVGLPLDPPNLHESQVEEWCIGVAEPGQLVHDLLRRAPDLDHVHPLEVGRGTEFHPQAQRQAPLQPVPPLL